MSINKKDFIAGVCEKYPEELLEKRIEIEGNTLACIFSDVLILDEIALNKNMFISKDGRFYYGLARNLRDKGFNAIDEVTVLSNSSDAVLDKFNELGGYETISNMVDVVNISNTDIYIDQLYRENMLCKMWDDGFDLFKKKEIKGREIVPLKLFRKMTCEQVLDYYETQLSDYEIGQSSKILEEECIEFTDKWLEELKEGENVGTPYDQAGVNIDGETINCFPFLSRQTLGLSEGTFNVLAAFSSCGKSTWIITMLVSQMYYGKNVLIISNEEQITRFRSKFLMYSLSRYNKYFKLTKSKLESGNITDEDMKQIRIARKWWNDNFKDKCHFIAMNCTDVNVMSKKVREYVLKYGVNFVCVDTFKLADDAFGGERTDLSFVRDSRELFNLARKYNITMFATAQLAERHRGTLFLTSAQIGAGKAIKEICETLLEMRRVYAEELDPKSKYYIAPFKRKKVNGVWIKEEYKADPDNTYVVLFPDKNRRGADSSNGEAYLLKFIGSQSVFKEVAYCNPKHGVLV